MKSHTKRRVSRVLSVVLLMTMVLGITGCEAGFNQGVNTQLATSSAADAYSQIFDEQIGYIRDLQAMGVLSVADADSREQYLLDRKAQKLAVLQKEPDKTNDTAAEIIQALDWEKYGGNGVGSFKSFTGVDCGYTGNKDCEPSKYSKKNFGHNPSCLHSLSMHDTYGAISNSGYKTQLNAVKAVDIWGGADKLQPIVEAYNRFMSVDVFVLNASRTAGNTNFQKMADSIRDAQSTGNTDELIGRTGWFTLAVKGFKPPHMKKLSTADIYKVGTPVNANTCADHPMNMSYYTLDLAPITEGLGLTAGADSPFSNGILINNQFFIVEYDVAVLSGFREASSGNYAPIFTYPQTPAEEADSAALTPSRTGFTGDASPYTESLTTTSNSLDVPDYLMLNVATGSLFRKGASNGDATASASFMGVGTAENMSAIRGVNSPLSRVDGTPYVSLALADGTTPLAPTKTAADGTIEADTSRVNTTEKLFYTHTDPDTGTTTELKYGQPVFVLAEYLELVYSPEVISGESLVAYGRKIRLDDDMTGSSPVSVNKTDAAYVIGAGLSESAWSARKGSLTYVGMTDFIDIDGLYTLDGEAKERSSGADALNGVAAVHLSAKDKGGFYTTGDAEAERGDVLPQIAAQKGIECVVRFGSDIIAKADNQLGNADSTQTPLYGIALFGGLYDRGLFSTWINASSNTGLDGWAKSLNDLGYPNYNIDGAVLTEQVQGNYSFELNRDGILSIDLQTVNTINQQNRDDRAGYSVVILRTILLILGFVLIAYVSVLLGAWALDVNLDLGINMLEKVTFGHFVAVRSVDEMPPPDPASITSYMDSKGIGIACIKFGVFGVFLIVADPVGLIIKLLTGLAFLYNEISKIILGTALF